MMTNDDDDNEQERMRVRAEREQIQEAMRRRPFMWAGLVLAIISIIFIIVGIVQMSSAESERHRGWLLTSCSIDMKYGGSDDAKCIYFSVRVNVARYDNQTLCAVPAALASEAWFHEPPACSHLNRADADDIEYWKTIGPTQVECYVPAPEYTPEPVTADECTNSVVTSNPTNVVWRSWIGRFVYLVRRPREGVTAIEHLTQAKLNAGTVLLIIGILLQVLAACFFCSRFLSQCISSGQGHYPPRITRYYRQRRAAAHKLY